MPDLIHPLAETPLRVSLYLCILLTVVAWLLSVVTRNYSWVDRLWSICPPVYCLIVAGSLGFGSARVNLMTALVVLWGARLTFNLARKGGYRRGVEDYHWAVVRERYGPRGFQVIFAAMTPVQMLIIWLFTVPVHQAWRWPEASLGGMDIAAAVLFLAMLAVETIADEQMWAFQQDKQRRMAAGERIVQRFHRTGLRRYSRHPNYLGEIGMWAAFYLFAVAASGQWLHWTVLGWVGLTLLVLNTTQLTETISASKYPDYRDYQESTPALIPFLRFRGRRR